MRLVIDTSVLVHASALGKSVSCFTGAVEIIDAIRTKHILVLDNEGEIEREYRKYALTPNSLLDLWWQEVVYSARRIHFESSALSTLDRQYLNRNGGHEKDYKFIAVSKKAQAPVLHEDDDYEKPAVAQIGVHAYRISARVGIGV